MKIEVDLVSLRACGPAPSEHREDKARNAMDIPSGKHTEAIKNMEKPMPTNGIQRGFPWTFHIYEYHSISFHINPFNIYIHNIRVSWGPLMNVDDLKSSQSWPHRPKEVMLFELQGLLVAPGPQSDAAAETFPWISRGFMIFICMAYLAVVIIIIIIIIIKNPPVLQLTAS